MREQLHTDELVKLKRLIHPEPWFSYTNPDDKVLVTAPSIEDAKKILEEQRPGMQIYSIEQCG